MKAVDQYNFSQPVSHFCIKILNINKINYKGSDSQGVQRGNKNN